MDLGKFLSSSFESKSDLEENKLLYVGALTHLKGLDLLVNAFNSLTYDYSMHLTIVGEGPLKDDLIETIRSMELEDSITFAGRLGPEQVRRQMLSSRCLVLPSRTEGFGRVLIEGLACYTPFVATKTGGPEEIAKKSGGGFIVPQEDVNALVDKISELFESKELRRNMGQKGRKYVENNFSMENYFRSYRKLIQTVSANSH
jgi:glycosyltransferase involved in cell wall biosynthesis